MSNSDLISDVFSTLRLGGGLYFRAELQGEFAVAIPAEKRRIRFHLLRHGRCLVSVVGADPAELAEGDIAIVPNGAAQVLSSGTDTAGVPLGELLAGGALRDGRLRHGAGDRRTSLLCGFCRYDEAIDHPVLANLPKLVVIRPGELGGEPWTAATLRLLALEADLGAQGTTGIVSRLLEIIFIQSVRRMSPGPAAQANGFISALSDAQLSRALLAMHGQPEVAWRVSDLARLAGMSRARFAERFTTLLGIPPNGYLIAWRLAKSRSLLTDTGLDMAEVAARCGYASVPSFTRRFKEAFGIGPGTFRRRSQRGDGGGTSDATAP